MADFIHTCAQQFAGSNISVSDEFTANMVSRKSNSSGGLHETVETRNSKRLKLSAAEDGGAAVSDGKQKVTHTTVERNRRKQMNHHLNILRSLMPCFYVKRGDQASIIGGVVDYITELQHILRTLEAKKQRKQYSDLVPSPRVVTSSPRKPPVSPRLVPISPRTPQPASPYRPMFMAPYSPAGSFTSSSDNCNELVAHSRSGMGEVEAKFVGGNLLVKTCSNDRIPGQPTKVIDVLEKLSLEVLVAKISVVDEAMVNYFTVKIGVECKLSVEELVQHIQRTFC